MAAAPAGARLQWGSPTDMLLVGFGPSPGRGMKGKSISPVLSFSTQNGEAARS